MSYSINNLEQNGFQLPDRVHPVNARQDKLKLRIGFWGFHTEDKSDCFEIMGDIALNTMCSDGEGNTHRLFRESLRGRGNSRGVVFANGGHGGSIERSRPLISGQSIWAIGTNDYHTPRPYSLAFDIYFNPTKAVQCQPLPRRLRAGRVVSVNRFVFDTSELFTPTYQFNDELVLTEEANLILGCSLRERMASPDSWLPTVNRVFSKCLATIDQGVSDTARAYDVEVTSWQHLSFQEAQIYWEFPANDAIQTMCELVDPIKTIGRGANVRHHPVDNPRPPVEHFDLNSPSIKIQWRRGIHIRIYAKTNKRVRFEVEFDKDAIKLTPIARGRVVTLFEQFIPALELLNITAAVVLNDFLGVLRSQFRATTQFHYPEDLIWFILNTSSNLPLGRAILSSLIHNGYIETRHGSDPRMEVLNTLVRQGVLVRNRPRERRFRIHERFDAALTQLQQMRRASRSEVAHLNAAE